MTFNSDTHLRLRNRASGRLPGGAAVVLLTVFFGASSLWGALWESPTWALHGDAQARVTYDSNIFGTQESVGDTIGQLTPALWLERLGSATQLDIRADADFRLFNTFTDENTINPSASLQLVFPSSDLSLPTQELNLQYLRDRNPDIDVGRRLWRTFYGGDWTGRVFDTGKTRLRASLEAASTDFKDGTEKSGKDFGSAGLQLSYRPDPLLELGGGASFSTQRYDSSDVNAPTLKRDGVDMFVSARGEFSPKLSGRIAGGATHASYSGGTTGADWDWIAKGNLNWKPDDRRQIRFSLSRRPSFSSDGQLTVYSNVGLNFYQDFAGGYSFIARTGAGFVDREGGSVDDYTFTSAGVSLNYNFTGKLEAEVGADQRWYNSDTEFRNFNRYTIYGSCGYRF